MDDYKRKMAIIKDRSRWNTRNVLVITSLVTITLFVVALCLSDSYANVKSVLLGVSGSLVSSVFIIYITSEYIIRNVIKEQIVDIWGLEAIYRTRAEMNQSTNEALRNYCGRVDIIAFGLSGFRQARELEINALLSRGATFRILSLAPGSAMLKNIDESESLVEGATRKSIEDLKSWADKINKELGREAVCIRYYDSLPLEFYFRVADRVFVGPYLKNMQSQYAISYEYVGGEGVNYWKAYFEKNWNSASE
ncbi:hypothetical protein [Thalassolituus sp. C2-1]|uniref:hypothetical protein n=1 Tax=Venatorbacter sp. C2-1 TaxID=2597518 RepID=UPI00119407E1|nr:hypothetical protein [Thalassolituus sp. C2-1]TVV45419.1 hypothetical protein FOT50_00855 [Thalassolituus sp. C2-1]